MQHDVVAIQRRDRVALAEVIGESRAADGSGLLTLVAEDGARFPFPSAQALVRVAGRPPERPDEDTPARLRRLRASAERPLDWRALHARVPEGEPLTAAALAARAGLEGPAGELAVALASAGAEPWFRREGVHWVAVPRADAEAKLARVAAARAAHDADAALLAWWPSRAATPLPDAARAAADALADFALRGQTPETERGRLLAARLDVPEPDQALEALVAVGAVPSDVNPAPLRAGLAGGFRAAALAEAERVAASPVAREGREDLTAIHAVAIDAAETTEVDDAIAVREAGDALEVFVHISDVAGALAPGTKLDADAARRVSSLYVPDGSLPMLPPPVVARLSLDPGVPRESLTGVFRVERDGRVTASRFTRAVVAVARRLTYERTEEAAALAATPELGRRLVDAANALRAARRAAGALIVGMDSLEVTLEDGRPRLSVRGQATPGDLVVAELMVLYNREAARLLAQTDAPAFYRRQDPPRDPAPDPADPLYALRARRRFMPSSLTIEPARHHGVGADAYLQATSPLRRFADLVNQRQVAAVAAGAKPPYRHADLERLVPAILERERAVRVAADDRADHWVARAFAARVGETIEGVLARPPRRGLGAVWVPSLCRELPLRPPAGWTAPPEGARALWRIARVAPWRGRIELEPV